MNNHHNYRYANTHPSQVCYDFLLDVQGRHRGVLWRPLFVYQGNNDDIVSALQLDNVMPGFDDAGAHCSILTDATAATSTVCYFGRDRVAGDGEKIPMEKIVKMQTSDPASVFGLLDRGVVRTGKRADLNVIDLDKLKLFPPTWANDLPTKAGRWIQETAGYVATICGGIVTFRHDAHTGALPGRLVRNPASVGLREGHTGA